MTSCQPITQDSSFSTPVDNTSAAVVSSHAAGATVLRQIRMTAMNGLIGQVADKKMSSAAFVLDNPRSGDDFGRQPRGTRILPINEIRTRIGGLAAGFPQQRMIGR
jgi:hypothetical protein